jgi:predicted NBD/HSP70 family sugar kinase
LLRDLNERTVLEEIRRSRSVSRAEVARRTGLSKPTVSLALRTLEASQLVRPVGTETVRRGRAGVLYEPVADAALGGAVEIAVWGVRAVLADLDGTTLGEQVVTWEEPPRSPDDVVAAVGEAVAALERVAGRRLDALVIGTPGVPEPRTGVLVRVGTIPALEGAALADLVEAHTGLRATVVNDVDLVALGEQSEGHGRDVPDFAILWIGSGLGSAIVLGGDLVVGHRGAAGEIFDVPFARAIAASGGPPTEFTELGLTTDGTLALARRKHGPGSGWGSAGAVLDAAVLGDVGAREVLAEVGTWAAWYVATIAALVDPELVVLAGPLGSHDALRPVVEARLSEWLGSPPDLVSSKLGVRSVISGAVAVAVRSAADEAFAHRVLARDREVGS